MRSVRAGAGAAERWSVRCKLNDRPTTVQGLSCQKILSQVALEQTFLAAYQRSGSNSGRAAQAKIRHAISAPVPGQQNAGLYMYVASSTPVRD